MALLGSCCGCSLAVSSAVLGVYLLVAYIIAFAVELWQILESSETPPVVAYVLCLEYFVLFIFSTLLLHGLAIRSTTFLLIWLFMMGVLLGPEAGLVLYLSIHYWKLTSVYGLVEITCWTCRLLVNAISLLCVQSLHSIWNEEKSVLLRLEALKTMGVESQNVSFGKLYQNRGERRLNMSSEYQGCKSNGASAVKKPKSEINSFSDFHFPNSNEIINKEIFNYGDSYFPDENGCSEFNASSFDPSVIDARLQNMPYLTIRKKSKDFNRRWEAEAPAELDRKTSVSIPKTRSLIDLSNSTFNKVETVQMSDVVNPFSSNYTDATERQAPNSQNLGNNTGSLDRKIIKNKNLKILTKFSPFLNKKLTNNVNIYQINPPKCERFANNLKPSYFDDELSKIYSNRGMYIFNEKIGKVLFYPPEFFCKSSIKFRNRIDSYGSNQSRCSIGTDSEDISHISDVAL